MRRGELLRELEQGTLPGRLVPVYGRDAPSAAYRLRELVLAYGEAFPCGDEAETLLFSTPGRTELGGNHTDHQHGHGLAASVDLDTIACVVPNDSRTIRIKSATTAWRWWTWGTSPSGRRRRATPCPWSGGWPPG